MGAARLQTVGKQAGRAVYQLPRLHVQRRTPQGHKFPHKFPGPRVTAKVPSPQQVHADRPATRVVGAYVVFGAMAVALSDNGRDQIPGRHV